MLKLVAEDLRAIGQCEAFDGLAVDALDLHLATSSLLVDAGFPNCHDPDGTDCDIGAYSGPGGGGWDLDGDDSNEWWQPGPYDHVAYPPEGWDCDDRDPTTHPAAPELCDGKDNDCDGSLPADEIDADGDGALDCEDADDLDYTVQ